jgi:hypothetical protein
VVAAALREATLVGLEPILEVPLAELARTWAAAGDAPVRVMALPEDFALARTRAVPASEPGVSPLAFALGWLLLRSPASRRPRPFR